MVEVFKTNVESEFEAHFLIAFLKNIFVKGTIHFDLEDRDKILRIEDVRKINETFVINDLKRLGYHCEVLSDFD